MAGSPSRRVDREAQRALIIEALAQLPDAHDPEAAAREVMRAMDAYIESAAVPGHREPPVTDYGAAHSARDDSRIVLWVVLGCGVLATLAAAVVLEGGWVAGAVILGIWVTALVAIAGS